MQGEPLLQIRVSLLGVTPTVWRRLIVPSGLDLAGLHIALVRALGWVGDHLHEFASGARNIGPVDPEDPGWNPPEDESKITVGDVLRLPGARLAYLYDFGDSWEHEIVLEKILPADPTLRYPLCMEGATACPPEDCGGPQRYRDLLRAHMGPDSPARRMADRALGGTFDHCLFDLDSANAAIIAAFEEGFSRPPSFTLDNISSKDLLPSDLSDDEDGLDDDEDLGPLPECPGPARVPAPPARPKIPAAAGRSAARLKVVSVKAAPARKKAASGKKKPEPAKKKAAPAGKKAAPARKKPGRKR